MRFWFDTEFYENGRTIDLISIGIVAEDGRAYYAESEHAQLLTERDPWLMKNVRPHLQGASAQKPRERIASEIVDFFGAKPEIWAYYADYDWVVLCQLYGRMIDLPKGWPMFCRDVKQLADSLGNPKIPVQNANEHDALADAIWAQRAWTYLTPRHPKGQPMTDTLLLPCPFCGSAASVKQVEAAWGLVGIARCSKCECILKADDAASVTTRWNRRATLPTTRDAVAAEREAFKPMPRGGVEPDWYVESVKQYRRIRDLERTLAFIESALPVLRNMLDAAMLPLGVKKADEMLTAIQKATASTIDKERAAAIRARKDPPKHGQFHHVTQDEKDLCPICGCKDTDCAALSDKE